MADPDIHHGVQALIAALEENGCDHPTYYLEEPGRYKPRWPGGWCTTCHEWLTRLRELTPRATPHPESDTTSHSG